MYYAIQKRKNNMKNRKGFTLIELIVVIAILGILAAILIPQFGGFQERAARTQVVTDAKQLATAIDSLIAESTTGKLDAAHGLESETTNQTTIKVNEAVVLSGIDPTRILSLTIEDDGGFTFTEKPREKTYTAKREDNEDAVEITP